jgi:hypothetical protein
VTTQRSKTSVPPKPAILSVERHQLGGLSVNARFACGHAQMNWFPHAPRRASRQEIRGWLFGSRQQDELCSRCSGAFSTLGQS